MTNTTSRLRFRVWDKQKAEYFSVPNGLALTLDGVLAFNTKQGLYPIPDTGQPDLGRDRWVVEQWIGLTDSTGQPVFEGDILSYGEEKDSDGNAIPNADHPYTWWERAVVTWYPELARFGLEFYSPYGGEGYTGREQHIDVYVGRDGAKVIGNVHEQPELLKS